MKDFTAEMNKFLNVGKGNEIIVGMEDEYKDFLRSLSKADRVEWFVQRNTRTYLENDPRNAFLATTVVEQKVTYLDELPNKDEVRAVIREVLAQYDDAALNPKYSRLIAQECVELSGYSVPQAEVVRMMDIVRVQRQRRVAAELAVAAEYKQRDELNSLKRNLHKEF